MRKTSSVVVLLTKSDCSEVYLESSTGMTYDLFADRCIDQIPVWALERSVSLNMITTNSHECLHGDPINSLKKISFVRRDLCPDCGTGHVVLLSQAKDLDRQFVCIGGECVVNYMHFKRLLPYNYRWRWRG